MSSRRSKSADRTLTAGSVLSPIEFAGLDELLGYRLRRAQVAVHRDYLAALGGLKLTQKQTAVIWLVLGNPGVAQGAIGQVLGIDRATMMALVDRLEARGLLRRSRSSVDARRRELRVTRAGQQLMVQVRKRIDEHEDRVKGIFSSAELRILLGLLQRLQGLEHQLPADD